MIATAGGKEALDRRDVADGVEIGAAHHLSCLRAQGRCLVEGAAEREQLSEVQNRRGIEATVPKRSKLRGAGAEDGLGGIRVACPKLDVRRSLIRTRGFTQHAGILNERDALAIPLAGELEVALAGEHPPDAAQPAGTLDGAGRGSQCRLVHTEHLGRRTWPERERRSLPLSQPPGESRLACSLRVLRATDDRSTPFLRAERVPAGRKRHELEPSERQIVTDRRELRAHLLDLVAVALAVVLSGLEQKPEPEDFGEQAESRGRRALELPERAFHLVDLARLRERPLQLTQDLEPCLVAFGQDSCAPREEAPCRAQVAVGKSSAPGPSEVVCCATAEARQPRVRRVERRSVLIRLLEVVADDLVQLDEAAPLFQPSRESLMELGARLLGQRLVGGVANQKMAEAEGIIVRERR